MMNRQTETILRGIEADGRVEESYELYKTAADADPKLATFTIERWAEIVAKLGHQSPPLVALSFSDERLRVSLTPAAVSALGRVS